MLEAAGENPRRYTPPFQRNRALGRRKSGDQNYPAGNPSVPAIPIGGCANSTAARFLRDRWTAAMESHRTDLLDRPVIYAGVGGSAWGQIMLPHQLDFMSELRRAYQDSLSIERPDHFA